MAGKKHEYTIYGSTPGAASQRFPQSPSGGSQQPRELREVQDLKPTMERILQSRDIKYPIRSKDEFMEIFKEDVPDICHTGSKKLSMRDLISIMRDDDFPIKSIHEAATLLVASCPVHAQAA